MTYRVILNERAETQLEQAFLWWHDHRSAEQAVRWYNGFLSVLETLRNNPERCALARESAGFAYPIRELLYGTGRRPTHRALFTVYKDMVFVFSIRHVGQKDVTPEEL